MKRPNLNVKIGQKIKIILRLKTKIINKKETKTSTFFFNIGKRINVDPSISSQDLKASMGSGSAVLDAS